MGLTDKNEKRVSFAEYEAMVGDRPEKFTAAQVNYRDADGKETCQTCMHFARFTSHPKTVCEIFRPAGEANVKPKYVCDLWTSDLETYPLFKESLVKE